MATSQNELTEAMKEMDDMKKKEKMEKRKASLIEAGYDEESVDETVAAFDALSDEAFETVVLASPMNKIKSKDDKMKEDEAEAAIPPALKEAIEKKKKEKEAKAEDEAEAEAEEFTQEAFEDVESSEATLVDSDEYDEVQATRASVADWLEKNVLSNK